MADPVASRAPPPSLASLAMMFVPHAHTHAVHARPPVPASAAPAVAWLDARLSALSVSCDRARSKYSTLSAGGLPESVLAPLEDAWAAADSERRQREQDRSAAIRKANAMDRRRRDKTDRDTKEAQRYWRLAEARGEQPHTPAAHADSDAEGSGGSDNETEPQLSQRARRQAASTRPRRAPSSNRPAPRSRGRPSAAELEEHREHESPAHSRIRLPDPATARFHALEAASTDASAQAEEDGHRARPAFLASAASLSTGDLAASLQNYLSQSGAPTDTTLTDAINDPRLREKISRTLQAFITAASDAALNGDEAAAAAAVASSRSNGVVASQPAPPVASVCHEEKLLWGLLVGTLASRDEEQLCIEWWADREKQIYSQAAARQRSAQQPAQQAVQQQHARAHQAAQTAPSAYPHAGASSSPPAPAAVSPAVAPASRPSERQTTQQRSRATAAAAATAPTPAPAPSPPICVPGSASASHAVRGCLLTRLHVAQEELRQLKAAKLLNEMALRQQIEAQQQAQWAAHMQAQRQQPQHDRNDTAYIIQRGKRSAIAPTGPSAFPPPSAAVPAPVAPVASVSSIEPMCRRFVYSLLSSALQNRAVIARQDRTIADLRWALAKARRIRQLTHNGSINRPASARPTWVSAVSVPTPMPRQLHDGTLVDFLAIDPAPPTSRHTRPMLMPAAAVSSPPSSSALSAGSSYAPAPPCAFAPSLGLEGAAWMAELSDRGGGDNMHAGDRGWDSGGRSLARIAAPSLLGAPPPLQLSAELSAELQATHASPAPSQSHQWCAFVRALDHSSGAAQSAPSSVSASSDPTGRSSGPPLSASARYHEQSAALPQLSLDDIPSRMLPRREYQGLSLRRPHPDRQPDANSAIRERERALVERARQAGLDAQFLRAQRRAFVTLFSPGTNAFEERAWTTDDNTRHAAHDTQRTHTPQGKDGLVDDGGWDDSAGRGAATAGGRPARAAGHRPPARPQSSRPTDRVFSIGLSVGRKKRVKPATTHAHAQTPYAPFTPQPPITHH